MAEQQRHRALVQVFARAPVPGTVKTRLIPILGAQGATELHCRLVQRALSTVAIARIGPTEVWTTPPADAAFIQVCRRLLGIPVHLQPEGHLGERMLAAATSGLARAERVLIVGTDVPGMHHEDLRRAYQALLDGADVVLGPAEDGGYWLIGMRRTDPELFAGIAWGSATVLEDTRARLRNCGWTWAELATHWDVDRPEDVSRLAGDRLLSELVADLPQPA